jgi:hypothetical protein
MDLSTAISAHAEWKTKLRSAAERKEKLDVATISADNCCALGKWLHGEAKAKYGALPAYKECLTTHAQFHSIAGQVAAKVNQAQFDETLIGTGSPFGAASNLVGTAIIHLKKEAKL